MPPRLNDNTTKVLPPNGGAPQVGQPFNYSTILDCVLIPRVIYADPKLSPGARLLWGVIRRLSFKTSKCFASDKRIAAELGVSERWVRCLSDELIKAGLMQRTEKPGKPTCRELLWHERFQTSDEPDESHGSGANDVSQVTSPIDSLGRNDSSVLSSLGRKYTSGDPGTILPGSSLYLEAPLESLSPKPPLPDAASVCNPPNSAPGKGASRPTSARVNGPPAPRATKTPERSIQAEDSHRRPNPNNLQPIEDKRTQEQLIQALYQHFFRIMGYEGPIDVLNAIAKILRARHICDVSYLLRMIELMESLKGKVDAQLWLKTAVEWP